MRRAEARGLCQRCYQRHQQTGSLETFKRTLKRNIDEWLEGIDTSDSDACWPWPGSKNEDGYGLAWNGHRTEGAHRVVYKARGGSIPDGTELDHICHNSEVCREGADCPHRRCVNPAHLSPATHRHNVRRALADLTVCGKGHEQTPENVVVSTDGARRCRLCRNAANTERERNIRLAGEQRVHKSADECINGHQRTPENTYTHPETGYRECYPCRRAAYRRYYARKKVTRPR